MTAISIVRALAATARGIIELSSNLKSLPSPLKLDQLLEAREPLENTGPLRVEPLESPARLLTPRLLSSVQRRLERHTVWTAAVDSSSRALDTPLGSVIVSGAAASANTNPHLAEVPSLEGPSLPATPPFIVLLPNTGPGEAERLERLLPRGIVGLRNPAGIPYDRDYSLEQALDEARLRLENWMLSGPLLEYVEAAVDAGVLPVVLVDGPLYPLVNALYSKSGVPESVSRAWKSLLRSRLEAVRRLEDAGGLVVGVVKRLDRATIIFRALEAWGGGSCLPGGARYGDGAALLYYLERCARWVPGSVYGSPRFRVAPKGLGVEAEKIVEYVVVPPGAHTPGPAGSRFYRLEYSYRTLERLNSLGLRGYMLLALDSVARGSLEPVTVKTCDWRSKMLTRALRQVLASATARAGVPVSYETGLEVGVGWRGRRSGVSRAS